MTRIDNDDFGWLDRYVLCIGGVETTYTDADEAMAATVAAFDRTSIVTATVRICFNDGDSYEIHHLKICGTVYVNAEKHTAYGHPVDRIAMWEAAGGSRDDLVSLG